MLRDLMNNVHLKPVLAPKAAVTDNTAQVGTSVDCQGYESVTYAIITGTLSDSDATFTVLLEESSDDSSYSAVADADLIGTEALASFTFADDGECFKIGYKGSKRYTRLTITPANNTGNLFVAAIAVLGCPRVAPTANPPQ